VQFLEPGEVAVGSTEFIVLRGREVGPAFAYALARSSDLREHAIRSMSGGSGRQRVATDCFEDFELPRPSADQIERFERTAMPMLEFGFTLRRIADKLEETAELLIPGLVSGRIDPERLRIAGVAT